MKQYTHPFGQDSAGSFSQGRERPGVGRLDIRNYVVKYVIVIAWCRVQYEKYFPSYFYFRHIARSEGECNIGNKKNEENISILHEAAMR